MKQSKINKLGGDYIKRFDELFMITGLQVDNFELLINYSRELHRLAD